MAAPPLVVVPVSRHSLELHLRFTIPCLPSFHCISQRAKRKKQQGYRNHAPSLANFSVPAFPSFLLSNHPQLVEISGEPPHEPPGHVSCIASRVSRCSPSRFIYQLAAQSMDRVKERRAFSESGKGIRSRCMCTFDESVNRSKRGARRWQSCCSRHVQKRYDGILFGRLVSRNELCP